MVYNHDFEIDKTLRKPFTYFAHDDCKSESNRLAPMSESEKVGQNSNSKFSLKKICCTPASNSYSFEDYFFLRSDKNVSKV